MEEEGEGEGVGELKSFSSPQSLSLFPPQARKVVSTIAKSLSPSPFMPENGGGWFGCAWRDTPKGGRDGGGGGDSRKRI